MSKYSPESVEQIIVKEKYTGEYLRNLALGLLNRGSLFSVYNSPEVNKYVPLIVARCVLLASNNPILYTDHDSFSADEIKAQLDNGARFMKKVYDIGIETKYVASNQLSSLTEKVISPIPAGYPEIQNQIYDPKIFQRAEQRTGYAKLHKALQEDRLDGTLAQLYPNEDLSELKKIILKYIPWDIAVTKSTKNGNSINNNEYTIEDAEDRKIVGFSGYEDFLNKLQEIYKNRLVMGNHKPIFVKADATASGLGVISFRFDELSEAFGSPTTNKTIPELEKTKLAELKDLKSGVIMEGVGDIDVSITFIKIDEPPYFKILFPTDNKVDANHHHIGNDIYTNHKIFCEKYGINDEEWNHYEKGLGAYINLWLAQNNINIESLFEGQKFSMDLRADTDKDGKISNVYVIDPNFGRFAGPAYVYLQTFQLLEKLGIKKEIGYIEQEAMALKSLNLNEEGYVKLAKEAVKKGMILSQIYNIEGNEYFSIIFPGKNRGEVKALKLKWEKLQKEEK